MIIAGEMNAELPRRGFLKSAAVLAAWPAAKMAGAEAPKPASPPAPEGAGLTAYREGPHVWIRWHNQLLTAYRAHPTQKYPYMYPLAGPLTGLSVTAETALPWPHHRSLFFGCDRVNDGNYWQEEVAKGQIVSGGPKLGQTTRNSVEILDTCEWRKPGGPAVMKDQRRITVTVASDRLRFVDWEIQWTALEGVVVQKTNHSLFAARVAPELAPSGGGQLVNAEGRAGEKATFGVKSAWCDFSGQRGGLPGELAEGVALMDHPENPWAPTPWFTRDYGFLSPTPLFFLDKPWELPAGQFVTLRYRVVLHAGDAQAAKLDAVFKQWSGG